MLFRSAAAKGVALELEVIGNVEASSTVMIKPQVSGELVKAFFKEGDFVRAGTNLAVLEMLLGGTTTYTDMYYFEEEIAETTAAAASAGTTTAGATGTAGTARSLGERERGHEREESQGLGAEAELSGTFHRE